MSDKNSKELVDEKINESNVSVYAYDKAIVEDFRARFKSKNGKKMVNDTVQIGSTDQMFRILGNINDDEVVMPFISLQRSNWQLNLDRQGFQTFRGDRVFKRLGPDNKLTQVRAQVIPITINYQLSVWTKDRITNDALVREILWYYHLRPSLLCYIAHGLNIAHKFNIYFNSEIEDNSDLTNQINRGVFVRQDLSFYTDDAYLWRANWEDFVKIEDDLYFSYSDMSDQNMSYTELKRLKEVNPIIELE